LAVHRHIVVVLELYPFVEPFVRSVPPAAAVLAFAESKRIPAESVLLITATTMGVSYAYNLATTLYNDVEQRPEMVKQGLTRAGIEKVRSVHTCVLPPTYVRCAFSPFHLPHRCSGRRRSSASRG